MRESLSEDTHCLQGLIDAQRGLRQPGQLLIRIDLHRSCCIEAIDESDVIGRLTRGALHLFMSCMPDEKDLHILSSKASRLVMDLRDERTSGIDRLQLT